MLQFAGLYGFKRLILVWFVTFCCGCCFCNFAKSSIFVKSGVMWIHFVAFQPLIKVGNSLSSMLAKEPQSAANNLFVVGHSNQQLHQNFLQANQKNFSSPSPDFSVSPSSSSTSNHSNLPHTNKDNILRWWSEILHIFKVKPY